MAVYSSVMALQSGGVFLVLDVVFGVPNYHVFQAVMQCCIIPLAAVQGGVFFPGW